jgi:DNA repair photolyase
MFVRWNNLSTDAEQRARLPGYKDEAVVRHFDTPEAMSINFYEVRAKTILNRVPEASQMPFRWTINPYRGCTHACNYCLAGDTRVLCADGREASIRDLEVGTQIYGTRRDGAYRRLVASEVLDKWSSIRPALVVELEDGTELVASEDHRFLSRRGWKYVRGSDRGPGRRPHLTVGAHLLGPGGSSAAPEHDQEYRRGYLCGLVRGEANLARYSHERPGRVRGDVYRFRLALGDQEALDRARRFLGAQSIATTEFSFAEGGGSRGPIRAIRSQARDAYDQLTELIRWPVLPTLQWARGFLAGIFDAEGSYSMGVLRISNTDEEIIGFTVTCAQRLGFEVAVEPRPGIATSVRVRGGMAAQLRFLLSTDPAITRKRRIEGWAIKSATARRVKSVRALDMTMRMYDITTETGDFIANGVVSHNCFARPTHKYLDFDAGRDFEREVVVKVNAPERLRVELAKPSWQGEHIALGTNTDPYQWVEGRYKLMRGIWEAMIEARNPGSVLTKSPLLLRDLDLMKELAGRAQFSAALSVPTLDERAWRATEPHTPHPRARLEAVAELVRAGIPTGILIAPLMPGINDAPEQLAPLLEMAAEAGALYVTGIALHLRADVRRLFFEWLSENRPDLLSRYRDLYRHGAYAPAQERRRLASLVQGPDVSPWQRGRSAFMAAPEPVAEPSEHRQESLFDTGRGETTCGER